jgi:hypothetical protein
MKNIQSFVVLSTLMIATFSPLLRASDRQFQQAVVVSSEKHERITSVRRPKETDAPPPGTEFSYDISMRVGCTVYVGRYRSELDFVPDSFAANKTVDISPGKHLVYAKIQGRPDVKMTLVRTEPATGDSCGTK